MSDAEVRDAALGLQLTDLAGELDLGDADLVDGVLGQIEAASAPRGARSLRWAAAAAAAVVLAIAAVIVEPSREALAGWLGIGSTTIERVPDADLPESPRLPDLGMRVPVGPGDTPVPSLGPPDAVFVDDHRGRSYVWEATDTLPAVSGTDLGVILSVRSAGRDLAKLVGEDDPVEIVRIRDGVGLWLPADHVVLDADGVPTAADRVLLWVEDGAEYRLETDLERPAAVALAAQVEGTPTG